MLIVGFMFSLIILQLFGWSNTYFRTFKSNNDVVYEATSPKLDACGEILFCVFLCYYILQLLFYSFHIDRLSDDYDNDSLISSADHILFLDGNRSPNNRLDQAFFVGISLSTLVFILFIGEIISEIYDYGKQKRTNMEHAKKRFQQSLVGSIVYGFNDCGLSFDSITSLIYILCFCLYFLTIDRLLLVLACKEYSGEDVERSVLSPDVTCWEGNHLIYSFISLFALTFYTLICSLLALYFVIHLKVKI
eukprot:UN33115